MTVLSVQDNQIIISPDEQSDDPATNAGLCYMRLLAAMLNVHPEDSPFISLDYLAEFTRSFLKICTERAITVSPEIVEIATGYGLNAILVDDHLRLAMSKHGVIYETIVIGGKNRDKRLCQRMIVLFGLDHEAVKKNFRTKQPSQPYE